MKNISVTVSVSGLAEIKQDLQEIEKTSKRLKELVRNVDRKIFESGLVLMIGEQETSSEDEITICHEN